MASTIDSTKPIEGNPTTLSVRANFSSAKSEIEALQAADIVLTDDLDAEVIARTNLGDVVAAQDIIITSNTGAIATKAPTASPTFTGVATIPTAQVTTLRLNGVNVTATATELNVLDGITATTAQLNSTADIASKAPIASPTFTGTATIPALNVTSIIQPVVSISGASANLNPALGTVFLHTGLTADFAWTVSNITGSAELVLVVPQNASTQYEISGEGLSYPTTPALGVSAFFRIFTVDGTNWAVTQQTTLN